MQTSGRSSAKSSRYGPDETSLGTIRCSLGWAGPAGLLAAGKAAESGAKVVVIEKMRQPGRKLLITGNGRSNITNSSPMSEFMSHVHPNGMYLRQAFLQFSSADMIALLKELELENHKVELRFSCRVTELKISEGKVTGVIVEDPSGMLQISARTVIVCTGGKSYPVTGSTGDGHKPAQALGHRIEALRPALVPLETEGEIAGKMQGLSLKDVKVVLWVNGRKQAEESGDMLFTHFGISRPAILTLSRVTVDALRARFPVEISIDLMPTLVERELDTRLILYLDADSGGYNLQVAWRTGYAAGAAAAESIE